MRLKSLQRGTTVLAAGTASVTASIAAVDTTKTIVFINFSLSDASPGFGMVTRELTNATTLTFARLTATSSPAITIRWTVMEFDSGISVQRGFFLFDGIETTHNVPISTIILANSFVSITSRDTGTQYGDDDLYRAELTTTTNLAVSSTGVPATSSRVYWEIAECTDWTFTTQTGNISFGTGDASLTAAPTSTPSSWLIFSFESALGTVANIGQKLLHGVVTSSTVLTFSRNNTGQTMVLTWFLVTMTDASNLQRGSQAFTTTDTALNVTLNPINPLNALAIAGGIYSKGGKSAYSADDNPGVGGWTDLNLTSGVNLTITRALTGTATAEVGWFVIEFMPVTNARRHPMRPSVFTP